MRHVKNYQTMLVTVVARGHNMNYFTVKDIYGQNYTLNRKSARYFDCIKIGESLPAFVCTTDFTIIEVLYPELDKIVEILLSKTQP